MSDEATELMDTQDWLLGAMADLPYDDLACEFQRGYLSALMNLYEAHEDPDLRDPCYLAAAALKDRMDCACALADGPPVSLRH